ncbi:LysR family transcriptional regulator [Promicromonospora sp. NPDC050262]|uniref:LysR family transcriptional regulator n=1 Tax=Promicromonospora sp. NPDC050262 TaxID=3155036 RepID=UPI0033FB189D
MPTIPELMSFDAVIRLGLMRTAAQELRIDERTVSKHVNALERKSGSRLLERVSGRYMPTAKGEEVARHARHCLNAHRKVVLAILPAPYPYES